MPVTLLDPSSNTWFGVFVHWFRGVLDVRNATYVSHFNGLLWEPLWMTVEYTLVIVVFVYSCERAVVGMWLCSCHAPCFTVKVRLTAPWHGDKNWVSLHHCLHLHSSPEGRSFSSKRHNGWSASVLKSVRARDIKISEEITRLAPIHVSDQ